MSNRHQRRANRARAKIVATVLAASCQDFSGDGRRVAVTDPRAVGALRRAFTLMLRQSRPLSMQISEAEAQGFPRWSEGNAGMAHVLAVALDPEGRGSYALRSCGAIDNRTGRACPAVAADLAEQRALEGLAEINRYAGFPAGAAHE